LDPSEVNPPHSPHISINYNENYDHLGQLIGRGIRYILGGNKVFDEDFITPVMVPWIPIQKAHPNILLDTMFAAVRFFEVPVRQEF